MSEVLPAGHYQSEERAYQNGQGTKAKRAKTMSIVHDRYVLTGAEPATFYVRFNALGDSRVIMSMVIDYDAIGSGSSYISMGTLTDSDAFISSAAASSAGVAYLGKRAATSMDVAGVRTTNSSILVATCSTTGQWEAGAVIRLYATVMEI